MSIRSKWNTARNQYPIDCVCSNRNTENIQGHSNCSPHTSCSIKLFTQICMFLSTHLYINCKGTSGMISNPCWETNMQFNSSETFKSTLNIHLSVYLKSVIKRKKFICCLNFLKILSFTITTSTYHELSMVLNLAFLVVPFYD